MCGDSKNSVFRQPPTFPGIIPHFQKFGRPEAEISGRYLTINLVQHKFQDIAVSSSESRQALKNSKFSINLAISF